MGANQSKSTAREDNMDRDFLQDFFMKDGESQIWQKRYGTEIASSVASVFSTFVAVSAHITLIVDLLTCFIVPIGFGKDTNADVQVQ